MFGFGSVRENMNWERKTEIEAGRWEKRWNIWVARDICIKQINTISHIKWWWWQDLTACNLLDRYLSKYSPNASDHTNTFRQTYWEYFKPKPDMTQKKINQFRTMQHFKSVYIIKRYINVTNELLLIKKN